MASCPKTAALVRLEVTMDLASVRACSFGRVHHLHLEEGRRALAVAGDLLRQGRHHLVQRLTEGVVVRPLRLDARIARLAVGQQQHGVIRRGVPVHGDHVEGVHDILRERLLQQFRRDGAVRRDKAEHRAHIRMDHAGALAHAAHGHRHAAGMARAAFTRALRPGPSCFASIPIPERMMSIGS